MTNCQRAQLTISRSVYQHLPRYQLWPAKARYPTVLMDYFASVDGADMLMKILLFTSGIDLQLDAFDIESFSFDDGTE